MSKVYVWCTGCHQPHEEERTQEEISAAMLADALPMLGDCDPPCAQLKAFEERLDNEVWERTRRG